MMPRPLVVIFQKDSRFAEYNAQNFKRRSRKHTNIGCLGVKSHSYSTTVNASTCAIRLTYARLHLRQVEMENCLASEEITVTQIKTVTVIQKSLVQRNFKMMPRPLVVIFQKDSRFAEYNAQNFKRRSRKQTDIGFVGVEPHSYRTTVNASTCAIRETSARLYFSQIEVGNCLVPRKELPMSPVSLEVPTECVHRT